MGKKKRNPGPRSKQSESSSSHTVQSETSVFSTIKLECERALSVLKRGSHNKAMRIMRELCFKHQSSAHLAFIHRIQSIVYLRAAFINLDDPTAQAYVYNAMESARKAVELSPCSIEYAQFYATLLYQEANYEREYDMVVKECERALGITNPIDPAKESLSDESQQEILTAEARIVHVQDELRKLIQRSSIDSLSTWARKMGMPAIIRRALEDPKEVGPDQNIRSNEIKKVIKSPEEKRREIEDQMTVARLLGSSSEKPNYGDVQKDWVSSYWSSLSIDLKKEFLRIRVRDLNFHFRSTKHNLLYLLIAKALSCIENNKVWKVWFCSNCNKEFSDSESYRHHVKQNHVRNLSPEMNKLLPQNVDDEWIQMILECSWKPLDASSAVKMLENQAKCKNEEINITEGIEVEGSVAYSLADGWPVSNDSKRAKLLDQIHGRFDMLIRHKYLAFSHLSKVIKFAMDEIRGIDAGSQLLNHGLDQSPTCICFLGASQLQKILKLLLQLCHACGLAINADKSTNPMDDLHDSNEIPEIKDKIDLHEDASCLVLDECLVTAETTPGATTSAAMDDVITPTSNDVGLRNTTDPFLSWISSGSFWDDQLTRCLRMREDKRCQGLKLVETLENEFNQLQNLSEKKCERMNYEEALQVVEDLCLEERKERENFSAESVQRSYDSILRKRKKELNIKGKKDVSNRESDAIEDVLREVKAMNANQSGACLESQMDRYIESAIENLKENLSEELSKIDAEIMRSVREMDRLELKLELVSAFDYRAIVLPLVKIYLREHLEDLAVNHATEKSDAAREALLKELALDSKEGVKGRIDSATAKHTEKTKNKKKNKAKRKTKDLKATHDHEQHTITPEASSSAAREVDHGSIPVSKFSNFLEEYRGEAEEMKKIEALLAEQVQLQLRMENEAKMKRLAELQASSSETGLEKPDDDKVVDSQ